MLSNGAAEHSEEEKQRDSLVLFPSQDFPSQDTGCVTLG